MTPVRVLFATAEFAPVSVVGGLASASAGLVRELRRQGADVEVVLPDYGGIGLEDETSFPVDVPDWAGPARVRHGRHAVAGALHLVELPGIARPHPYLQPDGSGWPDNDVRFLAFSQAVASLVRTTAPDVLHLNDWHTAAALAALDPTPPTVLSLHNLAYQGTCGEAWLPRLGPRRSAFARAGSCNPLAGGIALADAIVAVSPTYAAEIVEPAHGFGLDGLLAAKGDGLIGIRNGIDVDVWDPTTDSALPTHAAPAHLAPRSTIRSAVRDELGLPDLDNVPLVFMVTRLTWQKGVDLVLPLVPHFARLPVQLAVLGAGDLELATALRQAAVDRPATVAFVDGYDEGLGRRLFGGGDLLLMPSRFEPCGLTQMQAMRYGAIPVVTAVGGLRDTVVDADADERGNGFVAETADSVAILDALHRGARAFADKRRRKKLQRRGMKEDWSWREPASRHLELYENLARH
jgi:starch synthase